MKVTGTDGKEYTIEPAADLADVDLSQANLGGADLRGADLTDVCLSRADLSGTNLNSANLSKADLTDSNLSGAVWNGETVFPEGFEIPDELRG